MRTGGSPERAEEGTFDIEERSERKKKNWNKGQKNPSKAKPSRERWWQRDPEKMLTVQPSQKPIAISTRPEHP